MFTHVESVFWCDIPPRLILFTRLKSHHIYFCFSAKSMAQMAVSKYPLFIVCEKIDVIGVAGT